MSEIESLVEEVDKNVKNFVDIFNFLLKYRLLFRPSGLEFSGLREYIPGVDDASKIEWKASLRTQKLYVKQFEEERNLTIFILLDASATMLFGTQEKLKSEYASLIAATLAFAGIESNDNVGFAMFNDEITDFLEPSQDVGQYYQILKLLVDKSKYKGGCNMNKALSSIVNEVPERTALFIISDFIGVGDIEESLKICTGKFDRVYGIMVRDPRDETLPENLGYISFSDPVSKRTVIVDVDKIKDKFEEEAKKQSEKIEKIFIESNAGFIKVYTDKNFVDPIVKYLQFIEGY